MAGGTYRKIDPTPYLTPEIREGLGAGRQAVLQPAPSWAEDEERYQVTRTSIFRKWNFRPTQVSTCRELVAGDFWPGLIYDVNGYYRALGIGWPFRPTKRQLMEAYRDLNVEADAYEFATYAFKRLINPEFRARYDERPDGAPMDDKYRWAELKRKAADWASDESRRTGRVISAADFVPADIRAKMEADVRREHEGDVPPSKAQLRKVAGWGFGYYIWDAFRRDEVVLQRWQRVLLEACWEQGVSGRFAVGVLGGQEHQAARCRHDGEDVLFYHEDLDEQLLSDLAATVVASFLTTPMNQRLDAPITFNLDSSGQSTRDEITILSPLSAEAHSTTPEEFPMADDEDLDFASGGLQAAEYAKAAAAARRALYGNAYITQFLQDDGDNVRVRFLTDEPHLIETLQHGMVKTKPAPKDKPADRGWPETLSAVCRHTPVGPDRHPAFPDCYICDNIRDEKGKKSFAGTRLWGLAVIREPVIGTAEMVTAGQIQPHQVNQEVSYRDKTEEVDELDADNKPTGKKVQRKVIVIVNMAQANFWSPLMTNRVFFGTIVDRDYLVVRKGAKKTQKVQYEFVALNPVYVKHPESGQVVIFDLRDPKLAAVYEGQGMDLTKLRKHVARLASKKFYDRFFDPRVEVPWSEEEETSTPSPDAATVAAQAAGHSAVAEPSSGPTADQLARMRASLLEGNPPPDSGQAGPQVVSPL
jgi:hypothetical protein